MGDSQRAVRHGMPASVRQALRDLRPVPKLGRDAWDASRASFLAQASEMHLSALNSTARNDRERETAWMPWTALRRFALRDFSPMAVALKAVLVVALLMGGSVGTVSAARRSLPGALLYGFKVRLEDWELDRAGDLEETALVALSQTDERVSEATRLLRLGRPVPQETAERYSVQLELVQSHAAELGGVGPSGAGTQIGGALDRQLRLMERTVANVARDGESDPVDPGAEAMIRTLRAAQSNMGPGEVPAEIGHAGNGPRPSGAEAGDETPAEGRPDSSPGEAPGPGEEPNPGPDGSTLQDRPPVSATPSTDDGGSPEPDSAPSPGPGPGSGDAPGHGDGDVAPGPGPGGADDPGPGPQGRSDSGRS